MRDHALTTAHALGARPESLHSAAARDIAPSARLPIAVSLDVSRDTPETYGLVSRRTSGTISRASRRRGLPTGPLATTVLLLVLSTATAASQPDDHNPDGALERGQARELALRHSPVLAAAELGKAAAEQRIHQAGRWPNPVLEIEVDEIDGELSGLDGAELTGLLSQEIVLGGKIGRRRSLAEAERDLAAGDLAAARLAVELRADLAFSRVLLCQQRAALSEELLTLAQSFLTTVSRRVEAGKVSPVEEIRTRAVLAAARVEQQRSRHRLQAARQDLAAVWGATAVRFERAIGSLPAAVPPPPPDRLRHLLAATPEMRQRATEVQHRQLAMGLANAARTPDLTVSLGPRYHRQLGRTSWVVGLSLPLPVFDRNQGERRAAELELEQAHRQVEATRSELEAALVSAVTELGGLATEVQALEDEVIPAAQEAFSAIRFGYEQGKLGFLEVLVAEQALSEARQQRLTALWEYLQARNGLERLVGLRLDQVDRSATDTPDAQ